MTHCKINSTKQQIYLFETSVGGSVVRVSKGRLKAATKHTTKVITIIDWWANTLKVSTHVNAIHMFVCAH